MKGIIIKILLLALGFADFFGILPDSLDIVDKLVTALILGYFWYELHFSSFLFGKEHKSLSWVILILFYVLSLDSFVQLFRIVDLNSQLVQDTILIISSISGGLYAMVAQFLGYVYNPANAGVLSLWFARIGFTGLIGVAVYTSTKLTYTKKSVMHSFAKLFIKEKHWVDFSNTKGYSRIPKFLLSILVLFSIYQYFFALVTQWFVVSLDKALLVLAILYAVKDIQGTKSKALNTVGNFDNWLLNTITDLFTNHKKFYLAFGILLIFHYLSDLATFFLPYILGGTIDPFYLQYIGDSSGTLHQSLWQIGAGQPLIYILSTIGILSTILFAVSAVYLIFAGKRLHNWTASSWGRSILAFIFASMITSALYSWVKQVPLRVTGVQGVDFVTQQITHAGGLAIFALLFIGLLAIVRIRRIANHVLAGMFLMSFSYFAYYVWNYFVSSVSYHISAMQNLFSMSHFYLGIIFGCLLFLELLFYLGGALLLIYKASQIIIRDIVELNDRVALIWTGLVVGVPLLIMFFAGNIALSCASIIVLLLFSYALFVHHTGTEKRDDYMFALSCIITIYQFIVLIGLLVPQGVGLIIGESVLLLILAFGTVKYFGISLSSRLPSLKQFMVIIGATILFALGFFIVGEPAPNLTSIFLIVIFTLFVALAEELLFRIVLLYVGVKAFSKRFAFHLQAIFFSLIHIVGLRSLLDSFQTNILGLPAGINLLLYVGLLYGFSLVAARFAYTRSKLFIAAPVLFHFLVNAIGILIF